MNEEVATHLIWVAAGSPSVQMGRTNVREVPFQEREEALPCFWCGRVSTVGTPLRVSALSLGSFTNWDLAKRPDSGWLCAACTYCLKEKALMKRSWVASREGLRYHNPNDAELAAALLEPPPPPFAIGVRTREQNAKHMAIRARANYNRDWYWVQYGEESVWVHRPVLARACEAARALKALGAKRGEIMYGRYSRKVREAGDGWKEHEATLAGVRASDDVLWELFDRVMLGALYRADAGAENDSAEEEQSA